MLLETFLQCVAISLFITILFIAVVFVLSLLDVLNRKIRRRLSYYGKKRKRRKNLQSNVHEVGKRKLQRKD